MKVRTTDESLEKDPDVVAWLDKINKMIPSTEDLYACEIDRNSFGKFCLRLKEGKVVRVAPSDWNTADEDLIFLGDSE